MNLAVSTTDATFLDRLRCGDEAACTQLVEQHGGRMLAVARRILRHDDDAADAVQEAFVSAFRSIGKFAGGSSLGTWLHRIVVNACLMHRRTASRRHTCSLEDLLPQFDATGHHAEPVSRWSTDASERLQQEEARRQLLECLAQLPDDYREIIELRDIQQLETNAVAELLNVSEAVVKTRLHRARQALRTLLAPLCQRD